jgi:hypothetical protein
LQFYQLAWSDARASYFNNLLLNFIPKPFFYFGNHLETKANYKMNFLLFYTEKAKASTETNLDIIHFKS